MARGEGAKNVLERVGALAHNLWWSWNHDAQHLFNASPVLGRPPIRTR